MTIFFSGHSFKYELEGVCKLFFPLMRFSFEYHASPNERPAAGDYVFTLRREEPEETILRVETRLDGEVRSRETAISREIARYEAECERTLCKALFELLSDWLGVRPGWGILTGVRPVNIFQKERRLGKSDAEIARFFERDYLVAPEKLRLALETADAQAPLLESRKPRSYSLYVAIPFCKSRCSYCSFVSQEIARKQSAGEVDRYVELLGEELAATARLARELSLNLDSIYIGGGTPTALSAGQLARVTDAISANFDVANALEYTVEAGRADTITPEKLAVIRAAGAGRVSVNPQSFRDEVLAKIGRGHTAAQAEAAYHLALETGFDAINMDFIAGLPGDTPEGFRETIDKAVDLSPENVTVHTLTIKRSADLFRQPGVREQIEAAHPAAMTDYARQQLAAAGYRPYYLYRQKNTVGNLENVGYAKPGWESRYNVFIMDEIQTILACGAGGVTKVVGEGNNPIRRVFNYKYHLEYIRNFDEILRRKDAAKALLLQA